MAYASWSVVFGEQPTAAKWNILGTNDASFNDGTGIADDKILTRHILNDNVTMPKILNAYRARANGTTGTQALTGGVYAKIAFGVDSGTGYFDLNNNFDTTNYRYTAPVSGYYNVNANLRIDTSGGSLTQIQLYKNGAGMQVGECQSPTTATQNRLNYADQIYLAAGDYIEIWGYSGLNATAYKDGSYFSVELAYQP